MRTALVTGACGFMGSHMVDFLLDQGFKVRATDLENADRSFLNPRAEFVPSDVTRPSTLKGLFDGVERCYHVAALFSYSASFVDLYSVNVVGTRNLFRAALPHKEGLKSIVLWGASGVYGLFENPPVSEKSRLDPRNDYQKTKFAQEELAFDFERTASLPVTVMRLTSPYGPRAKYGAYVTFRMIALGQTPPFVIGTGKTRVGGMIHVRDVCRAAHFLSDRSGSIGEVYNVADDTAYTVEELCRWLGEKLHWPFYRWPRLPFKLIRESSRQMVEKAIAAGKKPKIELDMVDYAQIDCALDTSKIKALGFTLDYPDCKKGIEETIAWYRDEGMLPR
jgi:nucleoside-diphosphate-sugar epimerase